MFCLSLKSPEKKETFTRELYSFNEEFTKLDETLGKQSIYVLINITSSVPHTYDKRRL